MLDPRVETFLAVCETKSFTQAAATLHLSQPAVSQQVHALEAGYGTRLVRYSGRRLHLTAAGRALEKAATTVRNDDVLLRRQIAADETDELPLRFGVTMSIGEFVVARPLARLLELHPQADVRMEMANTNTLLERMRAGEINFALVEGFFDAREFDSETLSAERFIPVCAAGHAFARKPRHLADLLGEQVLVREPGSGTREVLERQLACRGLAVGDFGRTVQVGGMQAILQLLELDCGISFLYEAVVAERIEAGTLREIALDDFSVTHDFALVWERGSAYEETYREIWAEMRESYERHWSNGKNRS
jgi:DNA-binding transcriptional LysR family regulator